MNWNQGANSSLLASPQGGDEMRLITNSLTDSTPTAPAVLTMRPGIDSRRARSRQGRVDDSCRRAVRMPVRRECIRPKTCLHDFLDSVPPQVTGHSVANVEPNPAAAGGKYFRQDMTVVVDEAVRRRCEHVCDNVAALKQ